MATWEDGGAHGLTFFGPQAVSWHRVTPRRCVVFLAAIARGGLMAGGVVGRRVVGKRNKIALRTRQAACDAYIFDGGHRVGARVANGRSALTLPNEVTCPNELDSGTIDAAVCAWRVRAVPSAVSAGSVLVVILAVRTVVDHDVLCTHSNRTGKTQAWQSGQSFQGTLGSGREAFGVYLGKRLPEVVEHIIVAGMRVGR